MSELYSSGVINIPNVTGNIVITAIATPAVVSSISAVYTQSGTVYDTDSLDSLKDDLVVTASYEGGTSGVVDEEDYTLSGTLTVGTSSVTVSYGGKTTTFTVTVSQFVNGLVDGTYNGGGGQYTVSNNEIIVDTYTASYKNTNIPLKAPVELHSGDVVKFVSTRSGSSPSTSYSIPFALVNIASGTATGWATFSPVQQETQNKTLTLSSDLTATGLRIQSAGNTLGYDFILSVLVNNEVIF